nr:unnamed protein product [Digitaria exilis]
MRTAPNPNSAKVACSFCCNYSRQQLGAPDLGQKLKEETASKNQTELHTANSRAAMAKLAGTANKLTQTLELSPIFQFLIREREKTGDGEITSAGRGSGDIDGGMEGGEGLTAAAPPARPPRGVRRCGQMGTKMEAFPAAVRGD